MGRYFLIFLSWFSLMITLKTSIVQAQVVINEVLPQPSQGQESIELFNSGSATIELTNWSLWDQLSTPGEIFYFNQQALRPNQYLVVQVNNKLNNSGDGVTLKNQLDQTIDQMSYTTSQPDQSWARQPNGSGDFILTTSSLGLINPTLRPTNTPSLTPTITLTLTPTATLMPTSKPATNQPTTFTPQQTSQPSQGLSQPTPTVSNWSNLLKLPSINISTHSAELTSRLRTVMMPVIDLPAIVSVIIGGLILLLTGVYGLYEYWPS
ncbi:MAG: hypothetical protein GF390_02415 [Candidatus Pacebacteria bacterium]|nr:hypothetical protein [Candidatus Paceibacterota bacterium]